MNSSRREAVRGNGEFLTLFQVIQFALATCWLVFLKVVALAALYLAFDAPRIPFSIKFNKARRSILILTVYLT